MADAAGRCRRISRLFGQDGIEQLAVMRGGIFHIAHVLITAFDLERADAGGDQGAQIGALVVVFHRQ
jgi:hypothetical protein